MAIKRLYSRFWCTKDNRHRVFPYDRFDLEAGVEAPVLGKSGEQVLLSTLNNSLSPGDHRWAFCWACGETVQCFKKTQHEIRAEYFNRKNVITRRTLREVERKEKKQ